ncbi:MAG: MurR/RpiR family transcriptional regulator, partial [Betaproteobacteria bacterium]
MAAALDASQVPVDVAQRVRNGFDALSPEVRRAARWMVGHGSEVAMLSMRQQARNAGVSAPTMLRLARALGFGDYAALRRPFQEAIARGPLNFGERATALQSTPRSTRLDALSIELAKAQIDDVQSVRALNSALAIEATVKAIAAARRVGFLGVRSSFSIAYQFRYAYNLIATNGTVLDGLGGILLDQAEMFDRRDVLVAISQAPYSSPTVRVLDAAQRRGVTIVALTDSTLSPLARHARHTLLYRT